MADAALDDAAENTFDRWGLAVRPILTNEEVGMVLAISLGLGALCGENIQAEREWMELFHKELGGSALVAVLQGRFREVLNLVERHRGLDH